jgi:NADPH:quinone reductase-like Zn-dependent oxidoreductase
VLLLQLQAAAFEKRKQGATHQRHLLHAQATVRAARDRDEIMRKIAAHTYDHYTEEHIHATARSPLQYDTVVVLNPEHSDTAAAAANNTSHHNIVSTSVHSSGGSDVYAGLNYEMLRSTGIGSNDVQRPETEGGCSSSGRALYSAVKQSVCPPSPTASRRVTTAPGSTRRRYSTTT